MNRHTVFAAAILAFGVVGCTQSTTPLRSGGSGAAENRAFGTIGTVGNAPRCLPQDVNCSIIYNGPGGG